MHALRVDGILETALYCDDLEAAEAFYGGIVGLERVSRDPVRHIFFRCGDGMLLLFDPSATSVPPRHAGPRLVPPHGARGPGHVAFRVANEALDAWRDHLATRGVAIESEVDWPRGGRSVYVRDPAGNSVEFATPDVWR